MYAEERHQAVAGLVARSGRVIRGRPRRELRRHHRDRAPRPRRPRARRAAPPRARRRRLHLGARPRRAGPQRPRRHPRRAEGPHRQGGRSPSSRAVGGSVLLDAGTTTGRLALLLPSDRAARRRHPRGAARRPARRRRRSDPARRRRPRPRHRPRPRSGPDAVRAFAELRADVAFVGTNALSAARGLTTPTPTRRPSSARWSRAARRVVVLADSAKIGRDDLVRFAAIGSVDVLVTDDGIPTADAQRRCRKADVEVGDRVIVTLTANPSLDRTVTLDGPLERGEVQRATSSDQRARRQGRQRRARRALGRAQTRWPCCPAAHDDPLVIGAARAGAIPHRAVE